MPSTTTWNHDFEAIAYTPHQLGGLTLRNRIIKTATFEGMTPGGIPNQKLLDHHIGLAEGGVGMTTVAYCAVSTKGRTFQDQMVMSPEAQPMLQKLTDGVHHAGAHASIQLGHCGGFSKDNSHATQHPKGPSFAFNAYGSMYGMPFTHKMTEDDIQELIQDFAGAAEGAKSCGFDAVELHLGHGYLLSQWLSPAVNKRKDRWGGSLQNRLRLPLEVVRAVRKSVGPDFPIICKTNLEDGFRGGATIHDAIQIAKALEQEGVDALLMSGGFVNKTPFYLLRGGRPLAGMIEVEEHWLQKWTLRIAGPLVIRPYKYEELFLMPLAKQIREAVDMPLILLGGVDSRANLATAMEAGFDFVAMGRALIANPDLINRYQAGTLERSRCIRCNECMVEMDRGGVRCTLDNKLPE